MGRGEALLGIDLRLSCAPLARPSPVGNLTGHMARVVLKMGKPAAYERLNCRNFSITLKFLFLMRSFQVPPLTAAKEFDNDAFFELEKEVR